MNRALVLAAISFAAVNAFAGPMNVSFVRCVVRDSAPGANRDGTPSPAESTYLQIYLRNNSAGTYTGVSGAVYSTNSFVSVIYSNTAFGNIAAGQTVSNTAFDEVRIYLSASTPPGTDVPISLALSDTNGNTQTVSFAIFCLPKLDSLAASPQVVNTGDVVALTALFRDGTGTLAEAGITQVVARITGAGTYFVPLSNNPASTGTFTTNWTPLAVSDWQVQLLVFDARGNTGVYSAAAGFTTAAYDGSASTLLFYDLNNAYSYPADLLASSISNAGHTCYVWNKFYRGDITAAALSNQANKVFFYYCPGAPALYNGGALLDAVDRFIDRGGRACLVGGLAGYYMSWPVDCRSFMSNRFGSAWLQFFDITSDGVYTGVVGAASDPVGDGLGLTFDIYSSYFFDEIAPVGAGRECFRYNSGLTYGAPPAFAGSGIAGTRMDWPRRTVFLPWDPAGLQASGRDALVSRVMAYFALTGPRVLLDSALPADAEGDGMIEPGDEVRIACRLSNLGSYATNAQATLSTTSAWCSVSTGTWSIGNAPEGVALSNDANPFVALVAAGAPFGAPIPLNLNIAANGGTYQTNFTIAVVPAEPILSVTDYLINDAAGNTNSVAEAGERILLTVCLTNIGAGAHGVTAVLSTTNSNVTVTATSAPFGDIPRGEGARNRRAPFCFTVTNGIAGPLRAEFRLDVSCDGAMYSTSLVFAAYGYTMDTNAAFSWVDTSGGVPLTASDESYTGVTPGFSFPFYGGNYGTFNVWDNGLVMLETPTGATWDDKPIPTRAAPNALVAPFWDDFYPDTGSVLRCQLYGTPSNRYLAVEWIAMPQYDYEGDITFEALLHENGTIVFQYGPMSGEAAGGMHASIGLENPAGDGGVNFSYHQSNAVWNGKAIVFTPSWVPQDSDADGFADRIERFYFGGLEENPGDDSDNDGVRNAAEIRCGTDPSEPDDFLRVNGVSAISSNKIVLAWDGVQGIRYGVQASTNLSGAWTNDNPLPLSGAGADAITYTSTVDSASQPAHFFRITVP